ncbi:MAG: peptide MFS transporter [Phycisphaerales bacterium]|nr:peptide MFS transporter [Phycisphaerales bacterium]
MNHLTNQRVKHPKGLYVIFLTEMWERFAYYLMIGIFLLYLIDKNGMGFHDKDAGGIVGNFIALAYISPFLGGIIGDRYLGYLPSIFIGGIVMALGYFGLAMNTPSTFLLSLTLIIVGNGFFKPNISSLLGNLYNTEELNHLKDNAYNIYYMGINLGAIICNFIAAYLRNNYGWGAAFAAAGIGLLLGLLNMLFFISSVKSGNKKTKRGPHDMSMKKIILLIFVPAIIAALVGWFLPILLVHHSLLGSRSNDAFIFASVFFMAYYVDIWRKAKDLEKKKIGSLLFIFIVSIIFWTIYNQNATGLTLWAEKFTDRSVSKQTERLIAPLGITKALSDTPRMTAKLDNHMVEIVDAHDHPIQYMGPDPYFANVPHSEIEHGTTDVVNAEIFQSINPFFIILLTLLILPFFNYLRKRNKEPSSASKFCLSLFIAGLSAFVMVLAILSVPSVYTNKTAAGWLFLTYFIFTISEILLSPIGLSLVSKLSPPRLTAVMMAGMFLSIAIGGKLAGIMTTYWDSFVDKKDYFLILTLAAVFGGFAILLKLKSLNEVMKDK